MKNFFQNLFLYISAFIPLYFLIIVKLLIEIWNKNLTFNILNTLMLILNLIFIISGSLGLLFYFRTNKETPKKIVIVHSVNTTDQHFLGYFSLFVLFALTFDLERVSMAVVYIFVLVFIGVVYIKNRLLYINPFLNLIGYSFYNVTYRGEDGEEREAKIFYRGNLKAGKSYMVKLQNENFTFVDKGK